MLKIKNTTTGEEFEVAEKNLSTQMTWDEAKRACSELGNGWRLPTKEELKEIYTQLHKKGRGKFKDAGYWSGTEMDMDDGAYHVTFLTNGYANGASKGEVFDAKG